LRIQERAVKYFAFWAVIPLTLAAAALGDGPGDNIAEKVRPIPRAGIAVPDADRADLEAGIAQLGNDIEALRGVLAKKPALLDLLPDVQIYYNAARYALIQRIL
jgi:hypothetical protein